MRLNDTLGFITSVFTDWQGYLYNPRHIRKENTVTWKGCRALKFGDQLKPKDLTMLISEGQYTFQVTEDDSIIQIYYSFENNGITVNDARLAYYGFPIAGNLDSESGLEEDVPTQLEKSLVYEDSDIRWLRIEYHRIAARGILHSGCHMHVCGLPSSRFVVNRIPTPRQFVEFVMALCYPNLYQIHRLNQDGSYADVGTIQKVNNSCLSCIVDDTYQLMTHSSVPYYISLILINQGLT